MKVYHVLLLALIVPIVFIYQVKAQSRPDSNNLKAQAVLMAQAFVKQDFRTVANFTYPKVVALMGGEEGMIKFLQKSVCGDGG